MYICFTTHTFTFEDGDVIQSIQYERSTFWFHNSLICTQIYENWLQISDLNFETFSQIHQVNAIISTQFINEIYHQIYLTTL